MNTGDYYDVLYGRRQLECALGPTPVNAFQKYRQLRAAQRNRPALGPRPDEEATFQALRKQAQPIAVEPQHFYYVTAPPTKYKHVTGRTAAAQAPSAPARSGPESRVRERHC